MEAPSAERPATSDRSPRQRLLEAADALFYRHGIRATGVDAILKHAQVARRTLYHQFGGKDGLIVAYLRARDERWTAHWLAAIEEQPDPVGRLLAVFDALESWDLDDHTARGCAFIDGLVEIADPAHPVTHLATAHWEAMTARLETLAREANVDEPHRLAAELLLLYRGALVGLMVEPASTSVARARALAVDAFERVCHGPRA